MANTFPSAGDVGIGTTSPQAPLHVQSGSALLATFQSQSPNTSNSYIQLVSSNSGNVWQISDQDPQGGNIANGLGFIENTIPLNQGALARVYFQQGGNVGVGINNSAARFAVTNQAADKIVQLQGQAIAPSGKTALALGYGDNYDSVVIGDAGYIQAEHEGVDFRALHLNPIAGSVIIGAFQTQYGLPDRDQNGNRYSPTGQATPRLGVTAYVASNAVAASGSVVLGGFALNTVANSPASQVAGQVIATISGGVAGGSGTGSLRAIQAHRAVTNGAGGPYAHWGIEIGVHSNSPGNRVTRYPQTTPIPVGDSNVGLYIKSSHTGWAASGVRNNAGIYITGPDGWYNALIYTDTNGTTTLFQVSQDGSVTAAGGHTSIVGNLAADGTLSSAYAPSLSAYQFTVDSSGVVTAASYTPPLSQREFKKDISAISAEEAFSLLDRLDPFTFHGQHASSGLLFGLAADDAGEEPGALDVLTTLTKVFQELRRAFQKERDFSKRLREEIESLSRTA